MVAVAVSFAPLAADYTRHSRSPRAALAGPLVGYSVTQVLCYVIGLLALVTVARGNPGDIYGAFIALPVGRSASPSSRPGNWTSRSPTSTQPRCPSRTCARYGIAGCLRWRSPRWPWGRAWLNIADYENFLDLIGSVFVPMSAVLIVDYFVVSRRRWDLSATARSRWLMLLPWTAGFVTYQLINPGYVSWWVSAWTAVARAIGFTPASWMSASILSFAVAAVLTLLVGAIGRLLGRGTQGPRDRGTAPPRRGSCTAWAASWPNPDWPALTGRRKLRGVLAVATQASGPRARQ